MSGAEEFCQHDFFYLPTSLRTGMVFPRVLDTLQLAMSEVGSCGKTCLDGTNILDWDSKAAPLHMP